MYPGSGISLTVPFGSIFDLYLPGGSTAGQANAHASSGDSKQRLRAAQTAENAAKAARRCIASSADLNEAGKKSCASAFYKSLSWNREMRLKPLKLHMDIHQGL